MLDRKDKELSRRLGNTSASAMLVVGLVAVVAVPSLQSVGSGLEQTTTGAVDASPPAVGGHGMAAVTPDGGSVPPEVEAGSTPKRQAAQNDPIVVPNDIDPETAKKGTLWRHAELYRTMQDKGWSESEVYACYNLGDRCDNAKLIEELKFRHFLGEHKEEELGNIPLLAEAYNNRLDQKTRGWLGDRFASLKPVGSGIKGVFQGLGEAVVAYYGLLAAGVVQLGDEVGDGAEALVTWDRSAFDGRSHLDRKLEFRARRLLDSARTRAFGAAKLVGAGLLAHSGLTSVIADPAIGSLVNFVGGGFLGDNYAQRAWNAEQGTLSGWIVGTVKDLGQEGYENLTTGRKSELERKREIEKREQAARQEFLEDREKTKWDSFSSANLDDSKFPGVSVHKTRREFQQKSIGMAAQADLGFSHLGRGEEKTWWSSEGPAQSLIERGINPDKVTSASGEIDAWSRDEEGYSWLSGSYSRTEDGKLKFELVARKAGEGHAWDITVENVPLGANIEEVLASHLGEYFDEKNYGVDWTEKIGTRDGKTVSLEHTSGFSYRDGRRASFHGTIESTTGKTIVEARSVTSDAKTFEVTTWTKPAPTIPAAERKPAAKTGTAVEARNVPK